MEEFSLNLSIIMGFISGIGLCTGIRTMKEENKTIGIIQIILTFLAPISTILWCLKKTDFVFGGTDWQFIVQTAIVDKMIVSWIILLLYVILIGLIVYSFIKMNKRK